ncbi:hypothetical protein FGB62_238g06 [Gracilaria domingensis]|nr:hypothetical protein FGB62_238g06 [Gracilaria domingensis]
MQRVWRTQRVAVARSSRDVIRLPAHVCVQLKCMITGVRLCAAQVHEGRAGVRHVALPAQLEHAVRRARVVAESSVGPASAALKGYLPFHLRPC